MLNMMLATTANSTSVHFGVNNLRKKHNKLFTLEITLRSVMPYQDVRT